jgi:excisionase family DNA binding protein
LFFLFIWLICASVADLPNWLTVPQVARHCGVSAATVRREIKAGRLRVCRVGRVLRVLDEDVESWMRSCREGAA